VCLYSVRSICNGLNSSELIVYLASLCSLFPLNLKKMSCSYSGFANFFFHLKINSQVDQLVGKNHVFKRSIILVKAWCYYESRILGAHHGLLSTYAVEILVLYIINCFHSSVRGPLEVSYVFR
jgi:hypothetical protein